MKRNYRFVIHITNCKHFNCWLRKKIKLLVKKKGNCYKSKLWFKIYKKKFNDWRVTHHNIKMVAENLKEMYAQNADNSEGQ